MTSRQPGFLSALYTPQLIDVVSPLLPASGRPISACTYSEISINSRRHFSGGKMATTVIMYMVLTNGLRPVKKRSSNYNVVEPIYGEYLYTWILQDPPQPFGSVGFPVQGIVQSYVGALGATTPPFHPVPQWHSFEYSTPAIVYFEPRDWQYDAQVAAVLFPN